MTSYEILATSIGLLFCFYGAYTDLRYGKVRNTCSFGLIYAGVIAQIVYLLSGHTGLSRAVSVIVLGGAIAFLSYWFGILAPGDAKLLWGISMVLPPSLFQSQRAFISFPPIVLFINTFVIYFLFASIYLIVITPLPRLKEALKAAFAASKLSLSYLSRRAIDLLFFLIFAQTTYYLIAQLENLTGLHMSRFATITLVLISFYALNKILGKLGPAKYWGYAVLLPTLVTLLYNSPPNWLSLLKTFGLLAGVYILVYPFIGSFMLSLDSFGFTKEIAISELKEGMIPAECIVEIRDSNGVRYEKEAAVTSRSLDERVIVSPTPEGISKEQVELLKQLADKGCFESFNNRIKIQHPIHFAPFILGGVISTILCKGPFYVVLIGIWR